MQRIKSGTRVEDLHGTGKHGWQSSTPGPVTNGDEGWTNGVQEELARLIEQVGVTLAIGDTRLEMLADIQRARNVVESVNSAPVALKTVTSGSATRVHRPKGSSYVAVSADAAEEVWLRDDQEPSAGGQRAQFIEAGAVINDVIRKDDGTYILVGIALGTIKYWAWNGVTNLALSGSSISGGGAATSIAFGNGVYVMGTTAPDTNIHRSTDGIIWTDVGQPFATESYVVFEGGQFVLTASNGTTALATSPDGTTWTTSGVSAPSSDVIYGGLVDGVHYAHKTTTGEVFTSPDLNVWNAETYFGKMQTYEGCLLLFGEELRIVTPNAGTFIRPISINVLPFGGSFAVGAKRSFSETQSTDISVRGGFL